MKFDFAIGNPPYNSDFSESGDNGNFAAPVYNDFMDEAYKVADKVELIHPARFLFNAGSTPKAWNKKMLSDSSFKILHFEQDSRVLFPNTDIMGGIAISYHDYNKNFGAIETFVSDPLLRDILNRVKGHDGFVSIKDSMFSGYSYHFTEALHEEHPNLRYKLVNGKNVGKLSKGHDYDLKSNVLDNLPEVFSTNRPSDGDAYLQIVGRKNNTRAILYVKEKYIAVIANTYKYKVFIPCANGSKEMGSTGELQVIGPNVCSTETFMSQGCYDKEEEAINAKKYLSSKFARALFSVLKITQHITPETWKWVPLQDFTNNSDIDWSTSIKNIDRQLYKKYNLTDEEIEFIETHVKEMQ